jgi:hypothetical protein
VWQLGGFLRLLRFPPPIKLTTTMLVKNAKILLAFRSNYEKYGELVRNAKILAFRSNYEKYGELVRNAKILAFHSN